MKSTVILFVRKNLDPEYGIDVVDQFRFDADSPKQMCRKLFMHPVAGNLWDQIFSKRGDTRKLARVIKGWQGLMSLFLVGCIYRRVDVAVLPTGQAETFDKDYAKLRMMMKARHN